MRRCSSVVSVVGDRCGTATSDAQVPSVREEVKPEIHVPLFDEDEAGPVFKPMVVVAF
jgi:hypothetical protein